MALDVYKQKRKFETTPEPTGGKPTGKELRFVVQKHHASHLHYDFRLELRGVLKSWAVPKGLSMDPKVKRLAMLVEDHPWDYRDFEGIIPSGYGAGTVIVWDEGTYKTSLIKTSDKKTQEHSVTSQFWKGSVKFTLKGKKLKGSFTISRAPDKGENAWYIQKQKDQYATTQDISKKDTSVISGKTLEEVAASPGKTWESHRPDAGSKIKSKPDIDNTFANLIKQGKRKTAVADVEPMVCTLIKEPFTDDDWLYELKIDGYRIIAHLNKGKVTLHSRSGLNYTKLYPPVADALKNIRHNIIIDGEVAVLDKDGKPDFDKLQKYNGKEPLVFYVFDIVWADGYDLTGLDLLTRKVLLAELIPPGSLIRYTDHFEDGEELFEQVKKMGLEGIVAKRKDSVYMPGKRSKNWLKLPTEIRQEFVIGGWAESDSGRSFRSLLFGAYDKGRFTWIGHAGLGYKDSEMAGILSRLKKIEIKKSPFVNDVETDRPVHYVKPVLVGNFKFATWTAQGKIRKPAIFIGFRDDKDPETVVREVPLTITEEKKIIVQDKKKKHSATRPASKPTAESDVKGSNWSILNKQPITSKDTFRIEDKEIILTNVEKELWTGVTKADIIQYYHSVSSYILPYLKDRPESLHIKHLKPGAPGMYIKDMEGRQPAWADIFSTERKHRKKGKRNQIDYLVCQNEATLLYMVNLGCIDINPWTSRVSNYQQPDFIIIDLDPSDEDFSKAVETAVAAKKLFDRLKLKAFLKTSGKTGIHLYIPCIGFGFPEARSIAVTLCDKICEMVPDIATTENTISRRGDKLFIDYNQNDEADTVAAPYSVRPARGPFVSTPIEWKELNAKLKPGNFDIKNILSRIEKKGDIFIGALDEKIAKKNSIVLKGLL